MAEPNDQFVVVDIAGVDLVLGIGRGVTRFARRSRASGDLGERVTSLVVRDLVAQLGLPYARQRRRLFAGEAVRELAEPGDAVWGPGAALLLGGLRPELVVPSESRSGIVVGEELSAQVTPRRRRDVVDPRAPLEKVLRRIAASELVVTSSPSLLVAAEALGVPASAVRSPDAAADLASTGAITEQDAITEHYDATGRDPAQLLAATTDEARERGGAPAPQWDPHPLLDAFPAELWGEKADPTILAAIGWRARLALSTLEDAPPARREP